MEAEFGIRVGLGGQKRIDKDEYFLRIAEIVAMRSTCLRLQWGAILVSPEGNIISSGYTGAARGSVNCNEVGCLKDMKKIPSGVYGDFCPSVHAEENAVIAAARSGARTEGAIMYLSTTPDCRDKAKERFGKGSCTRCKRVLVNAGIKRLITPWYRTDVSLYAQEDKEDYLKKLADAR